jgi:hypothetical protein
VFVSARDVHPPWTWFVAWLGVGAGFALAVLGAFSIGIFVLPVVLVGAGFLATRRGARRGLPGLISGMGTPLFYVAYLNRDGPGRVCWAVRGGQDCLEESSPWPWLVGGALLVLVGVAAFIASSRAHHPSIPTRVERAETYT